MGASAPMKAASGRAQGPVTCRANASTAPRLAPPERPSRNGSASGLRTSACRLAPAKPSAPPTRRASTARGSRSDRTMSDEASWASGMWAGPSSTDRKSTRLNSSHGYISYAVFCLKKKNTTPNERWAMDFVSDCVATGRVIRMLTIVDGCTRECPAIEVDTSLGGLRVRRVLDRIASERGLPEAIVLDNGPEFRSRALGAWSEERGVRLEFIQPGKPVQNAYVESFNGRLRDECLNANWFTSLSDARRKIEAWRQDYNQQRPHSSLDYVPPAEFARTRAEMRA